MSGICHSASKMQQRREPRANQFVVVDHENAAWRRRRHALHADRITEIDA
jgi:hypothetical protein